MATTVLYNTGDQVGLEITFRNASGALTDPTAVTFRLTPPSGAVVNYTYGVDAQLVRQSIGLFTVDYIPSLPGVYDYSFTGTGAINLSEEGQFFVREPLAVVPVNRGYTNPRKIGGYMGKILDGQQSIQAEEVIAAVEQWIDRKLGRSWAGTSPTTERHVIVGDYLTLNNYPITAITSINVAWTPLATPTLLTVATQYTLVDATRGTIYVPGLDGYTATIVYTHAGPAVPADISLAATMIAAAWLQPSVGGVDARIKSVSYAGELSYTYADAAGERAVPPEACKLLDMVPRRRFA